MRAAGRMAGTGRATGLVGFCRVALLVLALTGVEWAVAQPEVYDVEDVKAAFLYHFATFVLWPEEQSSSGSFTIAVLGADDIAADLEDYLPGRSIQGRPMNVRRLDSIEDLDDAAVLYIGRSQGPRLQELLSKVTERRTLIVTDSRGALDLGSMINFRVVDRRVRFEISLRATERAGLELSSRLLSSAVFVDTTSAIRRPHPAVLAGTGRNIL